MGIRDAPFDGFEETGAHAPDDQLADSLDSAEFFLGARLRTDEIKQRAVAQDLEGRAVDFLRPGVAYQKEFAQHCQGNRVEGFRPLDA